MQQTASATPSRQERRVRRTRAMILAGFIQLMQQKPVKDISVRELADLVDINRSTFYLHYTDIRSYCAKNCSGQSRGMRSHSDRRFLRQNHLQTVGQSAMPRQNMKESA